jgi:hypothetical protein
MLLENILLAVKGSQKSSEDRFSQSSQVASTMGRWEDSLGPMERDMGGFKIILLHLQITKMP